GQCPAPTVRRLLRTNNSRSEIFSLFGSPSMNRLALLIGCGFFTRVVAASAALGMVSALYTRKRQSCCFASRLIRLAEQDDHRSSAQQVQWRTRFRLCSRK